MKGHQNKQTDITNLYRFSVQTSVNALLSFFCRYAVHVSVRVISSDPSCINANVRFTIVLLTPLSDQ